jgi:metal-responsive CopG/Arc/MetJ family transcriptional regulator
MDEVDSIVKNELGSIKIEVISEVFRNGNKTSSAMSWKVQRCQTIIFVIYHNIYSTVL